MVSALWRKHSGGLAPSAGVPEAWVKPLFSSVWEWTSGRPRVGPRRHEIGEATLRNHEIGWHPRIQSV